MNEALKQGDYVIATKYHDGDPQDHWAVGFYNGEMRQVARRPGMECVLTGLSPRYDVVDAQGVSFRANGFRRVEKISHELGHWFVHNVSLVEHSGKSIWDFVYAKDNFIGDGL